MVERTFPRSRFRHSSLGVAGVGIALVALVLVPCATVAGLMVGMPPGTGRPSAPGIGAGSSVTITTHLVCETYILAVGAPICALEPYTLWFAATLNGGANASLYVWTFGDGTLPAFGQSLEHIFPGCGEYTVSVVALGGGGGTVANSTTVYPCIG